MKDMNQRGIQMADKLMGRYLMSLASREMPTKTVGDIATHLSEWLQ